MAAQPILPADDAALERALADAHIPSLMAALVHITGAAEIIRGDIRPKNDVMADAQGDISEAQQAHVRAEALAALRRFRDSGQRLPPPPTEALVGEIVSFMIGQPVPRGYAEFLTSELALR